MSKDQEFPENRPKDKNGCALPTPLEIRERQIREARIRREQAQIEMGFDNQPIAGHDYEQSR